jgi:hypothetical protein
MAITHKFHKISLLKEGALAGTVKDLTTDLTATMTYYSFGADNDLWGATLSADDVNNAGFGFGVSFEGLGAQGFNVTTKYLCGTNYGLSVPAGATINGVKAEVGARDIGTTSVFVYVDHLRITVYYTEGSSSAIKTVNGLAVASVKTLRSGLAIASGKTFNGLA